MIYFCIKIALTTGVNEPAFSNSPKVKFWMCYEPKLPPWPEARTGEWSPRSGQCPMVASCRLMLHPSGSKDGLQHLQLHFPVSWITLDQRKPNPASPAIDFKLGAGNGHIWPPCAPFRRVPVVGELLPGCCFTEELWAGQGWLYLRGITPSTCVRHGEGSPKSHISQYKTWVTPPA